MNTLVDFSPSDANNLQLSESQKCHVAEAIQFLEPEIKRLKARLDAHQKHLKRLRASQAPIKRLSPEILSEIFRSLLQDSPGAHVPDDSAVLTVPYVWSYVPWVARQVCSRWRQVAVADKRLWNCLRLVNPPFGSHLWRTDPEPAWSQLIDFAITFIPENGPVHIAIDFSSGSSEDDRTSVMRHWYYPDCIRSAIRDLLSPLQHRLKTLEVSCDVEGFLSYLTNGSISHSLPSLEHLTLNCVEPSNHSNVSLGDILSNATSLRTLRIVKTRDRPPNPIYRTTFLQKIYLNPLQELVLDCPLTSSLTIDNLLCCLSQCPSLTHLTLEIDQHELGLRVGASESEDEGEDEGTALMSREPGDNGTSRTNSHRVCKTYILPSLTHLYLMTWLPYLKFYQNLTCPKLQVHCFSYIMGYGNLINNLIAFLQRSDCGLRVLADNTDDERIPLKKGDPLLQTFLTVLSPTIEQLCMDLPLAEASYEQIADGSLLPRLRAISVRDAPLQILKKRLGWLDPSVYSYEGIRKIRTPIPWDEYRIGTSAEEILEDLENTHKGLEVKFGPKHDGLNDSDWTDTSL